MPKQKQLSEAERIAEMLGVVVGAASHCPSVSAERITSLAVKVKDLVRTASKGDAEAEAADARFQWAMEVGRSAVADGSIDTETAETALDDVEEQLAH